MGDKLKVEKSYIHQPKNTPDNQGSGYTPKINAGESILDSAKRVTEWRNRKNK